MGFSESLHRFHDQCAKTANRRLRRIAMTALQKVVIRTPVKTGCARANWNVSVNQDNTGHNLNITDYEGGKTISKGTQTLANITIGNIVYLTNTVPYIIQLEYGYSRQHPNGFLRLTAKEIRELVRREIL